MASFLDYAKEGATFVFSEGIVSKGVFAFSVSLFISFLINIIFQDVKSLYVICIFIEIFRYYISIFEL